MSPRKQYRWMFATVLAGLLTASWSPLAVAQTADAVVFWNTTALTVTAPGAQLPSQSRILAIEHAAIHDALNAVARRYEPYLFTSVAPVGASPEAAIAAAARDVLVALVPAQLAAIDAAYDSSLAAIPDSGAKTAGIAAGQAAARAILEVRASDGSANANIPYVPGTRPGDYQLTPGVTAALLPGWGRVRPFTLSHPSQHRLRGPDRIGSDEYDRDFNEVKILGSALSSVRTPDQSQTAVFFQEGVLTAWNRIARSLSVAQGLDHWEKARLFALLNFAIADGLIAGWDSKYYYNFWRPVTAIRLASLDGNGDTQEDPAWSPVFSTPAHPDYPSTNSVNGVAAATVMAQVLGDRAFSATSTSLPGVTRTYSSFIGYAIEGSQSRVFAGIHFRKATEDGRLQGRDVGRSVLRLLRLRTP